MLMITARDGEAATMLGLGSPAAARVAPGRRLQPAALLHQGWHEDTFVTELNR
ncbi:MAG: hypothetical protein AB7U83_24150 [Vicinamibacterales bacterium]